MTSRVKDDQSDARTASAAPQRRRSLRKTAAGRRTPERPLFGAGRESECGVRRLYTVAMMAAVLDVPQAAVRYWSRTGQLEPKRRADSIEWFDFGQLVTGRQLARLLGSGLSLREIDAGLRALAPGESAVAARCGDRIVVDGRRLSMRQGDRLVGSGGQLQFGFYSEGLGTGADGAGEDPVPWRSVVGRIDASAEPDEGEGPTCVAELLDLAADLEAAGEFVEAAEAIRAVLQAAGPSAPVVFMLAELLYRSGDLTAARERYYAAVELDADHLEARASLGCVLSELGEHDLAIAALEGVLHQQPDYADAHWHMAGLLEAVDREPESRRHLELFISLAPESPWADAARDKLHGGAAVEQTGGQSAQQV
jgi:tetratricopeptide (TPR) repeat protein